ncbi:hypothetical protein BLOT_008024 [Blomia tropicalis]|nr:hypothetical protein BLOT_008024 [Blomia tropicalis]
MLKAQTQTNLNIQDCYQNILYICACDLFMLSNNLRGPFNAESYIPLGGIITESEGNCIAIQSCFQSMSILGIQFSKQNLPLLSRIFITFMAYLRSVLDSSLRSGIFLKFPINSLIVFTWIN